MKAMFYPDASVYHIVTDERLKILYVARVAYRNGISMGFTEIREKKYLKKIYYNLKNVLIYFFKSRIFNCKQNIKNMIEYYRSKGYLYIILCYYFDKNVNAWIKRKNYIDADIKKYIKER